MNTPMTRRTVLALSTLALAGACSQMAYDVEFTARPEAIPPLLEVINGFTREYGYRKTAEGEYLLAAEYAGWRSQLSISRYEPETYYAAFHHKSDLWLIFGPHADLSAFLDDFKSRIARVEGVGFPRGYP